MNRYVSLTVVLLLTVSLAGTVTAADWGFQVDCHHGSKCCEQTDDLVTVSFYNGSTLVGSNPFLRGAGFFCWDNWIEEPPDCDSTCDVIWDSDINPDRSLPGTSDALTHIIIQTASSNAFLIDEAWIVKNGNKVKHFGADNGGVWTLSTDPADGNGAASSAFKFVLSGPGAGNVYAVSPTVPHPPMAVHIDHYDDWESNTHSWDTMTITVAHSNGTFTDTYTPYWKDEHDVRVDIPGSGAIGFKIHSITISTDGRDGYYIDRLRVRRGTWHKTTLRSWGSEGGSGWALSKDKSDGKSWNRGGRGTRSSFTWTW